MLQTKRALLGLSGTYDIANERSTHRNIECLVVFPDNTQQIFILDRRSKGQSLLERVFSHLNLAQDDFFSLKLPHESHQLEQQCQQSFIHPIAAATTANQHHQRPSIVTTNYFSPAQRLNNNSLLAPSSSSSIQSNAANINRFSVSKNINDGNSYNNNSQSQSSLNASSSSSPLTSEQNGGGSIDSSQSPHHHFNSSTKKNHNSASIELNHNNHFQSNRSLSASLSKDSKAYPSCWLDPNKGIVKQYKWGPPYKFYFCVRFYVSDTSKLIDEITIDLLFLQLKNDILQGHLPLTTNLAVCLAGLLLQSQVGDYTRQLHDDNYISKYQLLPDQNDELNKRIVDYHKQLNRMTPSIAKSRFLELASTRLECYGVEFYDAQDFNKISIQMGVSSNGIVIFKYGKKINSHSWAKIIKIMFKREIFSIHLRKDEGENCDNIIEYNLLTNLACKSFWQECVAQHSFFRLQQPKSSPKKFFSFFNFGSKFQYSGKTEYQTMDESRKRTVSHFSRTPSKRYARRTIPVGWPAWNSNEHSSSQQNGQSSSSLGNKNDSNSDQDFNQVNGIADSSESCIPQTLRSFVFIDESKSSDAVNNVAKNSSNLNDYVDSKETRPDDSSQNKNLGRSDSLRISRSIRNVLFSSKKSKSSSSNQFTRFSESFLDKFLIGKSKSHKISKSKYENIIEILTDTDDLDKDKVYCTRTIKLAPGKGGRYGFKIKEHTAATDNSKSDIKKFIVIHEVSPDSPAATCNPRIQVGDQIITVNGTPVAGMQETEIEAMIKNMQHQDPPDLILGIHAKIDSVSSKNASGNDGSLSSDKVETPLDLHSSIQKIKENLESKEIMKEFENLSRKNDFESLEESKSIENIDKNRYRDILPYDSTRVSLMDSMTGDYINASYVNMTVPSGTINRYIATQGPLASTCDDFWQMVWEQNSSLIIMVTPLVEAGRVKCHKYWPDESKQCRHGQIVVKNIKEKSTTATIERSLQISDIKGSEKRIITQIQYRAWPDHEVPEDCSDFLKLVNRVRKHRISNPEEPIIVHCSAGIGRTGVLILMESAICFIEAGEPVSPIDILMDMRKQRAMLIQTSSQFQFVADAICKVYDQKLYKSTKKFGKKSKSK